MSQTYSMSGMVTNDTEQFLQELRQDLKVSCEYCGEEMFGKRVCAKYCGRVCYQRDTTGKYRHDEVPTNCAWCGNDIVGRKHGVKFCGRQCSTNARHHSKAP